LQNFQGGLLSVTPVTAKTWWLSTNHMDYILDVLFKKTSELCCKFIAYIHPQNNNKFSLTAIAYSPHTESVLVRVIAMACTLLSGANFNLLINFGVIIEGKR
jgi:hypothetical protein